MWVTAISAVLTLCVTMSSGAPAPALGQDWPERYLDREVAMELYGMLQNYLWEGGAVGPMSRQPGMKRNSEIINSLLALPKSMADVGKR